MTSETVEKEIWMTSQHEERFSGEEYPSKEEAIRGGYEEYDGEAFYVGRQTSLPIESWADGHADNIEEQISVWAYEEVGDFAEDWPRFSNEEKAEIEAVILKVLQNNIPSFFKITDVIQIPAFGEEPE